MYNITLFVIKLNCEKSDHSLYIYNNKSNYIVCGHLSSHSIFLTLWLAHLQEWPSIDILLAMLQGL